MRKSKALLEATDDDEAEEDTVWAHSDGTLTIGPMLDFYHAADVKEM